MGRFGIQHRKKAYLAFVKSQRYFNWHRRQREGSKSCYFRLSLVNASLSARVTVMVVRRHKKYVDGLYSLDHDNLCMMLYRYN